MVKSSTITITDDRPINIIESVWHYLSPFSAHQVEIWGEIFPTVEHAYHWKRFQPGVARNAILKAKSPVECLSVSRHFRAEDPSSLDPAFNKEAAMEEIFRAKLAQHPHVVDILRASGTRGLLKVIAEDAFWGTGPDGSGENKMGKLWMKLRAEL